MSSTQIWANLIAYFLQIGMLVGIGASLPALLRFSGGGKASRARLSYWQIMLVACLALPWVRPWHQEIIAVTAAPLTRTDSIPHVVTNLEVHRSMPPIAVTALWLLAAGVVVRLILLALGFIKLARYRRNGQATPLPPEWNGLAGNATLLISNEVSGPVTFGLFRPVVLLPSNYPAMSEQMRNAILFHELLHVERRDWIFTLGEELTRAVFWFHPAIWWVLGEIQLAREQTVDQAVIEMTQARDHYVDTLLAMAGVSAELDLAPAPLFLRRRHLKQRVLGIVQEGKMSKTQMMMAQLTAIAGMALAGWVITGFIPMEAQAQVLSDGAGVTVNLNGSQLLHRSPILYPTDGLSRGVSGTVVVQVRLDTNGEVIDDSILSGPDELRKGVQQSVLGWHFDKSTGGSVRVVNIDFVKPEAAVVPGLTGSAPPSSLPAPAPPAAVAVFGGRGGSVPSQAAQLAQVRAGLTGPIDRIEVDGLSDSAKSQVLSGFPVRAGDTLSPEAITKARNAARQFDEHLVVSVTRSEGGPLTMRIAFPPGAVITGAVAPTPMVVSTAPVSTAPLSSDAPGPGVQRVGGNVMASKLIAAEKPIYPPLAKMARQQGTVKFEATIAKEGNIEELKLISGPPLLVAAAQTAAKQWVYSPTFLNGVPVKVMTTIDIVFTLADDGTGGALQ